ncbi:hypothetical protein BJX61DRAFT_495402 [Aspergillus egyptiacus]|nr:hypothetical protein BJX61DRAFT_495402 [Aspergillus egyptiacus]
MLALVSRAAPWPWPTARVMMTSRRHIARAWTTSWQTLLRLLRSFQILRTARRLRRRGRSHKTGIGGPKGAMRIHLLHGPGFQIRSSPLMCRGRSGGNVCSTDPRCLGVMTR